MVRFIHFPVYPLHHYTHSLPLRCVFFPTIYSFAHFFVFCRKDFWLVQIQENGEEQEEYFLAIIPTSWILSENECLFPKKTKRLPPYQMEGLVRDGFRPVRMNLFQEHRINFLYGDSKLPSMYIFRFT